MHKQSGCMRSNSSILGLTLTLGPTVGYSNVRSAICVISKYIGGFKFSQVKYMLLIFMLLKRNLTTGKRTWRVPPGTAFHISAGSYIHYTANNKAFMYDNGWPYLGTRIRWSVPDYCLLCMPSARDNITWWSTVPHNFFFPRRGFEIRLWTGDLVRGLWWGMSHPSPTLP